MVLKTLFEYSPSLKVVYDFQNQLTEILDMKISKEETIEKINDWTQKIRNNDTKDFEQFIQILENSLDKILHYFDGRSNSYFRELV